MINPYLRAAERLRQEAEEKLQARLAEPEPLPVEAVDVAVIERAKDSQGRFIPDDPTTPDVNEAWVEVPQE